MSLQAIEARVKEITTAIEQSLANHNALLGRLAEAQHMLSVVGEVAPDVAEAASVAAEVVSVL